VAVLFASTTMVVPPLNRTLLKKHAPTLRDIQALATGASEALDPSDLFDKQCAMVFDALLLNYPQLKQEDFDDLIDMHNMQAAFPAACGNLAQAREVNAKNAAAESLYGSSTGTQTPPASLHGLDGLSGPAGT
jgi:hypothetical protein